jgi:L,D-transpeptidase ErfK/SrfK
VSALYLASVSTCALAAVYELPADGSAVVGTDSRIKVSYYDTLLDVARQYSLGYPEIVRANPGADTWLPGEGREILLPGRRILPPTPHEGIVVNLPEHRLYYYPKPRRGEKRVVVTYPVSIGRMDWHSPLGQTWIIAKERHPSWYPPESIRKEHAARGDPLPKVVPPGAKNPLGDYKMRLAVGDGTYEIHGTNNPVAVGLAVTHGCIRMYPEDVAALFASVPIRRALRQDTAAIHWDFAREALEAATGMPIVVGLRAHLDQASRVQCSVSARCFPYNLAASRTMPRVPMSAYRKD